MITRKHTLIFEEYLEQKLVDRIYENWKSNLPKWWSVLNEEEIKDLSDYTQEDYTPSKAEERAFKQNLQVITRPQMAALYLYAVSLQERGDTDLLKMIDRVENFGSYGIKGTGPWKITYAAMGDAIGLDSDYTVSSAVKKFRSIIRGEEEYLGQLHYPKMLEAHSVFQQFKPWAIAQEASIATEGRDPKSNTIAQDKVQTKYDKANVAKEERQKYGETKGDNVNRLINTLMAHPKLKYDRDKAERVAIANIATKEKVDPEVARGWFNNWLDLKRVK